MEVEIEGNKKGKCVQDVIDTRKKNNNKRV